VLLVARHGESPTGTPRGRLHGHTQPPPNFLAEHPVSFVTDSRFADGGLSTGVGAVRDPGDVVGGREADGGVPGDVVSGEAERLVGDRLPVSRAVPPDVEADVRRSGGRLIRDGVEEVVEVRDGEIGQAVLRLPGTG
jgi:hypothetical protein